MSEEVLGIIAPTESRGKGRLMRRFALIFTSNRIVATKIAGSTGAALSASFGGLAGVTLYDRRVKKKVSKLADMSINDILKADKNNYAIPYSDILKVEMKKGSFLSPPKINISTTYKNYSFRILKKKEFKGHVDLLRSILHDKVSVT